MAAFGFAKPTMAALALASCLGLAAAQDRRAAEAVFDDPALEARVQELSGRITCLVCEGQSVRDSNALFAEDVRFFIRARIREGADDAAITADLTERYGDAILYRPPFNASSALLWAAPALFVLIGGFAIYRATRSASRSNTAGSAGR